MSCVSTERFARFRPARARGYSFLEMLLAVTILAIFLGGVYATYIHVINANRDAEARLEALRSGRAALISLSDEIKTLTEINGEALLISPDVPVRGFGDGIDNDGDGRVDEEPVNGLDDETTGTLETGDDRHAVLDEELGLRERPLKVGVADLGDASVDEDVLFGQDFMIFQVVPEIPIDAEIKTITYALPTEEEDLFEGMRNVLVRQTNIDGQDDTGDPRSVPVVGRAPIAFDVLGFDLLFWDSNAPASEQRWVTSWDSTELAGEKFQLPASILIRLTLAADRRPDEILEDGDPVETIVLQTVVNIESVIGSPLYERPVLP